MTQLNANQMDYRCLNEQIHASDKDVVLSACCGQRFIGAGIKDKSITIHGTPGNALGAYLSGGHITVYGNVQDAVGDTMDDGSIVVHGSAGDALGYAMRGGSIFIKGDAGYRIGIHMKAYKEKQPAIVIGGAAGSFLGEYMAGGLLIVLNTADVPMPLGQFTGTGMHGGKIFVRANAIPPGLPEQVSVHAAEKSDLEEIAPYCKQFAGYFNMDAEKIMNGTFYVLTPNLLSPYKRLYTTNEG